MAITDFVQNKGISVVMATCNGEKFLEDQIDSILAQTKKPVEIIVCDDQSSDRTVEILEKYKKKGKLQYDVNQSRLGVIDNFKKVVSLTAPGNYIALSDQDDIWLPNKLEQLSGKLMGIDDGVRPAMVYSDLMVIDKTGLLLNPSFWNELGNDGYKHSFKTLLFGNFVTGCSVMMNGEMKLFFDAMPSNVLMHDVWLGLIAYSFGRVDVIADPLVKYRKHDTNAAYAVNYKKKSSFRRRVDNLWKIFSKNEYVYLDDELKLANQFYTQYEDRLNEEDKKLIVRFLELRNRSFIKRKVAFRASFKSEWI